MRHSKMLVVAVLLTVSLALTGSLVAGLGSQNEEEVNLEKGLVGYWSFDEGEGDIVFDSSGYNNDQLVQCYGKGCSPPRWVTGKIGSALEFDEDDYIDVGNDARFDFCTRDFTVSAWAKGVYCAPMHQSLVGKRESWAEDNRHSWNLYFESADSAGKSAFRITHKGGSWNVSGRDIRDGFWHHVVGMRRGANIYMYVDAKPYGPVSTGSVIDVSDPKPVRIGKVTYGFLGIIDEVRIYNRALTEDEIMGLYEQGQQN